MKKINIDRDWLFQENSIDRKTVYPEIAVDLPHDFIVAKPRHPENPGTVANGFFGNGVGTYRKELDVPQSWLDGTVLLDIDGAYMNAEVWLNGELLSLHPYGYTAFLTDLTDTLKPGRNRLRIVTESLQPSTRWYSGGGLYRSVSIWTGGKTVIRPWDMFITTPVIEDKRAVAEAGIVITGGDEKERPVLLKVSITDPEGRTVSELKKDIVIRKGKNTEKLVLEIKEPLLWDIGQGNMYKAVASVESGSDVIDSAEAFFGIRKLTVDADNGLTLNGRPVKLKGGCIHHDNGLLGAAAYPRAEERKIEILREAGFNAVRISHYPPSLSMLETCDRQGMLLLDEAFDCFRIAKNPLDYHLYFEAWWERDIESMVLRDRNHPCVITYSIGNEIIERDGSSGGAEIARALADKIRSLDDTRFVISALHNLFPDPEKGEEMTAMDANTLTGDSEDDYWGRRTKAYTDCLDIVGYNYLRDRYEKDRERFPGRVIVCTESFPFYQWDYWQGVMDNSHVIGDFTWTAYDNLGEVGVGRVEWGTDEKIPFFGEWPWRTCWQGDHDLIGTRRPQSYFRKIMWGDEKVPAVFTTHPCHYGESFVGTRWHWYDVSDSWTYPDEYEGKPVPVQVYGAGDRAEFFVNGKKAGETEIRNNLGETDIIYEKGTLEAVVLSDGKEWGRTTLETAGDPFSVVLSADRTDLKGDRKDLSYITVTVTDSKGRRVPWSKAELCCSVSKGGILKGFGSGDPRSLDAFGTWKCHAFEGRALAIVAVDGTCEAEVTVTGEGLKAAKLSIRGSL
ncbi:MAG: DUF4982 domain-containing protein [Christensenellaceae bacterium]|nr:DUF4982 domain-containing protein [Christensenellaceae bacterium]